MIPGFINVDLEVESPYPLDHLREAFEEMGAVSLFCGKKSQDAWLATFECESSPEQGPGVLIDRFCVMIDRLEGEARKLWDTAVRRDFDLGFEGGESDRNDAVSLAPELRRRMASHGVELKVSHYPAE